MSKTYTCICGKTFDNPQKFNGHKSNCIIHKKAKGNYEERQQQICQLNRANNQKKSERCKEQKTKDLQQWILEQHTCEKCGKIMTEKYGSGRFCSKSCANSRTFSEESIAKKSDAAKRYMELHPYYKTTDGQKRKYKANLQLIAQQKEERKRRREQEEQLILDLKKQNEENNEHILTLARQTTAQPIIFDISRSSIISGYYTTPTNGHPRAINDSQYVFVHVLMAERILGRYLTPNEVVHHFDENKLNNSPDNIIIFDSKASHVKFHYSKDYVLSIDNGVVHCDRIVYNKRTYRII